MDTENGNSRSLDIKIMDMVVDAPLVTTLIITVEMAIEKCDGCDLIRDGDTERKQGRQTRPIQCLWKGTFEKAGNECRSEPLPAIEQSCPCQGKHRHCLLLIVADCYKSVSTPRVLRQSLKWWASSD